MLSTKQRKILAFPYTDYDALICDGAIRSGKTMCMITAFIDDSMRRFDRQKFAICGKTVSSVIENVVKPYMALDYARNRYQMHFSRAEKLLTIKDGRHENVFEVFGGKDESSYTLIQGRTLAGLLIDEVALQPRSFVEQAMGRCSVEGSKMWFNCNPDSPQHWFYKEWICDLARHNAYHIHFQLEDNPSLSEKKIAQYKSNYSGVFYDRYIKGDWVVADGLVYPQFKQAYTGSSDVLQQDGELCWVSIDYGITNPFAALMWVIRNGVACCVDEYVYSCHEDEFQRRKTDDELYQELDAWIKKRTHNKPQKVMSIIVDPSATSFKETIARKGAYNYRDATNSVVEGIQLVQTAIKNDQLKVNSTCKHLKQEAGLYSWDTKASERVGVDKVIKENDHAMDSCRYFIATVGVEYLSSLQDMYAGENDEEKEDW